MEEASHPLAKLLAKLPSIVNDKSSLLFPF
jgi:hypothetical protein